MVELRRNVELREIELRNLERELARQQELRNRNLISPSDLEAAQRRVDESRSQLSLAQERLALQEGGKVLTGGDRKSTRLNSSHSQISYAVFCLKKKNN